MALPSSDISIPMVKAELGAAANDVGQLCIHPNVNKWSKWKPVRHPKVTPLTEGDLRSRNYGLSFPINLDSDYTVALEEWIYSKPTGGADSPFRLGDFRNYNHQAIEIMWIDPLSNINVINPNYTVNIEGNSMTGGPYQIGVEDLKGQMNLNNFYFGCIFRHQNGDTYIKTATTPISTRNLTVSFSGTEHFLTYGNYIDVYFVFCDTLIDSVEELSSVGLIRLTPIPSSVRNYRVPILRNLYDIYETFIATVSRNYNGPFTDLQNYNESNTPPSYFLTNLQGSAFFQVTIRNKDSAAKTFNREDFYIEATKRVDGSDAQRSIIPLMYYNGNSVQSITVNQEQIVTIVFGHSQLFTDELDILPIDGDNAITSVKLLYKHVGVYRDLAQSINFRIKATY